MFDATLFTYSGELLFWSSLIISSYIGFVYFRDLGDVVQMVLKVKRENMARQIRNEKRNLTIGLLGLGLMSLAYFMMGAGNAWAYALALGINIIFFGFTYIWVHLGLRSQQASAKYYSVEQAKFYISPNTSVMVIENNGHARAHSDYEMLRPHIAGDEQGLGGENIVMTYCAMSNLGVAYKPEIEGKKLRLSVLAQHGNNLIMRDDLTGEPVQQIIGKRDCDDNVCSLTGKSEVSGTTMQPWPTYRMSFHGFAKAYPEGEVFLNMPSKNPVLRLFDFVVNLSFVVGIDKQHREAAPVMDNMSHYDDRLPNKMFIWGFTVNNEHVCYTKSFVMENNNLINVKVGGQDIVVVYSPQVDSIGVYYNHTGKPVSMVDLNGNSPESELALSRVETLKSGMFWHVWAEFHKDTDINRVTELELFAKVA